MNNYEKTNTSKSNFQLIKDLLDIYHPAKKGIASEYEVELIRGTLCIEERDLISLQNLRDFSVLFLSEQMTNAEKNSDLPRMYELMDISSAITCVIDQAKFKLGGAV